MFSWLRRKPARPVVDAPTIITLTPVTVAPDPIVIDVAEPAFIVESPTLTQPVVEETVTQEAPTAAAVPNAEAPAVDHELHQRVSDIHERVAAIEAMIEAGEVVVPGEGVSRRWQ